MGQVILILAFAIVSYASMSLIWGLIIQECDTSGQFKNNGTVYVCHKSTAPTDEKEWNGMSLTDHDKLAQGATARAN